MSTASSDLPLAPTLMLQGTASSVGKSLLVAALCRIYARRGVSVAPFKSQNMALNADVTPDGLEIGRAQSLQARAARLLPRVEMNPILLKPEADACAQVVVMGRARGRASARAYHEEKMELRGIVEGALTRLRREHDLVIIEGAGSPAEINLRDRDLVNMFVAHLANASVLLVGDIDRGGVFAHLLGTLELLDAKDRRRVDGLLVNKFRGDVSLLTDGLVELEAHTGCPVRGVIPYVPTLRLPDEDSHSQSQRVQTRRAGTDEIEIAVIPLPYASNLDDFDPLGWESGVLVREAQHPTELEDADLVVLPGSKSTLRDLDWLHMEGYAEAISRLARRGKAILGVCGGCQMLGRRIVDEYGIESPVGGFAEGLGLLPIETRFMSPKRTLRVELRGRGTDALLGDLPRGRGYWIHAGRVRLCPDSGARAPLEARPLAPGATTSEGQAVAWSADGAAISCVPGLAPHVVGTMVHGLFDDPLARKALLDALARRRGGKGHEGTPVPGVDEELDRLADAVEESVDLEAIEADVFRRAAER